MVTTRIADAKRLVIKVGSALVTNNGEGLDLAAIDENPARCFDPQAAAAMEQEVSAAHRDGDTLGGVVEVLQPPGGSVTVHP